MFGALFLDRDAASHSPRARRRAFVAFHQIVRFAAPVRPPVRFLLQVLPARRDDKDLPGRYAVFENLWIYCPLTTLAHHCRMKSRDNMADVIEGLREEHGLLAAFLEAADKLDCRALNRRVAMAKPINVEAHQASASPVSPQVAPAPSSLILRRANLTRASE